MLFVKLKRIIRQTIGKTLLIFPKNDLRVISAHLNGNSPTNADTLQSSLISQTTVVYRTEGCNLVAF